MPRSLNILLICIAIIGTNGMILSPVLTDISAGFGVTPAVAGRAIAGYGAGTALVAFWLGRSLDGFGLTRSLTFAMAVAGLAMAGSSLAQGWLSLTLLQFIAGCAAGVALPAIYGITGAISPKGAESRFMSRVLLGWSVSLVAAIPLGALMSDLLGWRLMLVVLGGLSVMLAPLAKQISGGTPAPRNRPRMRRLGPLFLPGGWVIYGVCALFMTSFYGTYAYMGDLIRSGFGLTTTAAGMVALAYGIGFGIAGFGAALIDRLGRRNTLRLCLALAGLVLLGMSQSGMFVVFLALVGAWGVVNHYILNTIVVTLNGIAPDNRSAAIGLYSSVTYIAASAGVLMMGQFYQVYGFTGVAMAAAALHVAGFGLSFMLGTLKG